MNEGMEQSRTAVEGPTALPATAGGTVGRWTVCRRIWALGAQIRLAILDLKGRARRALPQWAHAGRAELSGPVDHDLAGSRRHRSGRRFASGPAHPKLQRRFAHGQDLDA